MLMVRLDVMGDLDVHWPRSEEQIVALAQAYLAQQATRPPGESLGVPIALIEAALAQTQAALGAEAAGEQARAVAAEQYRQAVGAARALLDGAVLGLKGHYAANLAQLEEWGLHTKAAPRGVVVLKPTTPLQWVDFLLAYVAREEGLPVAERLPHPPLAQMSALAQTVQTARTARDRAQTQREVGRQAREAAGVRLLRLLQAAAILLVTTAYDDRVTSDLQRWGYAVVARRPPDG